MKIRNLALALMLGAALGACQQNQDTAEKDQAAQQAADAQQKLQDAEKAADDARKEAADAEKRAARAERRSANASSAPVPVAVCNDCGTVSAITPLKQKPDGSGVGAVLGAGAGGVAGHQVGGGRGKDVATVLGALAGAYAGNQAEKTIREETVYRVSVSMDAGGSRDITVKDASNLSVGSKVRVNGDVIEPRG
jgi:outer membrane lipoprotein SlyB